MRRCVVVLACFIALLLGFVPELALAAKAKPKPPAKPKAIYEAPMSVVIVRGSSQTCEPTCPEWISAEGEITGATPAAFARVFKAMGKKRLPVVIRSPGGSINAAVEIGRMVRKRGLDVAVGTTLFQGCSPIDKGCKLPVEQGGNYRGSADDYGGFCNSACPLILAAGKTRLAAYGTQVGVHKPRTMWTQQPYTYRETYRMVKGKKKVLSRKITSWGKKKTKFVDGYDKRLWNKLSGFYREMGVDVEVLKESEKAGFSTMIVLNGMRLNELHLRTGPQTVGVLTAPSTCKSAALPANCIRDPNAKAAAQAPVRGRLPIGVTAFDPDMAFVIVRNHSSVCEPSCPAWIAADGAITQKTPDHFKVVLKGLGNTKLPVVFNSPGGDLEAAITLGELIRAAQLQTVVGKSWTQGCDLRAKKCPADIQGGVHAAILQAGTCSGACIAAFVGGEQRSNAFDSDLLVHSPALDVAAGQTQPPAVMLFQHFSKMGIDRLFMQRLNQLQGWAIQPVTGAEQSQFRLVSDVAFKKIVPTPARCKEKGFSSNCFTTQVIELRS